MRFTLIESVRATMLVGVRLAAIVAIIALPGCGSDTPSKPNPPNPGSTSYTRTVTGSTTSGSLSITIATSTPAANPADPGYRAQADITATGTFTPAGGAAVALTGTWDNVNKTLDVLGGGWSFLGGLNGFGMEGTFDGPGGVNGSFSLITGSSSNVTIIVGTFAGTNTGRFNFSISGSEVHGNSWESSDVTSTPLDGTFDTPTAGHIRIYMPGTTTAPYVAEGDFNGTTASGTWDLHNGDSGTWTGTKQ